MQLVCRYLDKYPNDVKALFLQYEIYCAVEKTVQTDCLSDIRNHQLDKIQNLLMSNTIEDVKFISRVENSIGIAKIKQGKFFEAEIYLKRATELDPSNIDY